MPLIVYGNCHMMRHCWGCCCYSQQEDEVGISGFLSFSLFLLFALLLMQSLVRHFKVHTWKFKHCTANNNSGGHCQDSVLQNRRESEKTLDNISLIYEFSVFGIKYFATNFCVSEFTLGKILQIRSKEIINFKLTFM